MVANAQPSRTISAGGQSRPRRDFLATERVQSQRARRTCRSDGDVPHLERAQHPTANGKVGGDRTQLMRKKIDDGGFETPYRLRKQVVEPVFGQIKQARGFRQFLLRGVKKVRAEWAMICTTHNLLKLFTLAKAA